MYRSAQYLRWIAQADQLFVMNKPKGPIQKLVGPFVVLLELKRPDKRHRDADNLAKICLDFATRLGLIEDDRFCQWLVVGWVDNIPYGAKMTLLPFQKEGLPEILAALTASLVA